MPLLRDPRTFLLILVWVAAVAAQVRTSVFDAALLGWFHAGSNLALVEAAQGLTLLGGWTVLIPATFIAAALLWRRGERRSMLYLLAFTLWGRVMVDAVKLTIDRARPNDLPQLAETISASFPSGHAANATIVYGAIALLLAPGQRWALSLAIFLSAAIGITRLALGVHWPSDVVGGWALGLLWTLALHLLLERDRPKLNKVSTPQLTEP